MCLSLMSACMCQKLYAESIAYANGLSGTSVAAQQLRNLRAGASEVPVLTKGNIVLVLPSEHTYEARVRGEYLPFWVAKIVEDEDAALGTRCLHMHALYALLFRYRCMHATYL